MRVIAINGSPRSKGNTSILLATVCSVLEEEGIGTETVQLGGRNVCGCRACGACFENRDGKCSIEDDMNHILERVFSADGMIIGSPTYFSNVTAEVKAFIDRAGLVSMANGRLLRRRVGAAVAAVRRAGAVAVFDAINRFFLINQMIVPGSSYWNLGIGRQIGEVEADEEGLTTMKVLGENMAWVLGKLQERKTDPC